MTPVILESPYARSTPEGIVKTTEYARRCVKDCLERGETAYASHLLLTQEGILRDGVPEERELGISAGLAWHALASRSCVYLDEGLSSGMWRGVQHFMAAHFRPDVRFRWLDDKQPRVHALKTVPPFFSDVGSLAKTFEIRRNDRDFLPGDVLRLLEWKGDRYSGRESFRLVTYVLRAETFPDGLREGYVALGLLPIRPSEGADARYFQLQHANEPSFSLCKLDVDR